jgi:hypothetical protein
MYNQGESGVYYAFPAGTLLRETKSKRKVGQPGRLVSLL